MQLELGHAGTKASPRPWVETAPNQGKRDWARTQHDPEDSAGIPPLVGLYSLPWVTGILHDHKRAKGIEITRLNLCNPLSLGEKYFSWALLPYIGLFLRDLNFSKCLASKESQGKNSVCLDDLKKNTTGRKTSDVLLDAILQSWRGVLFSSNRILTNIFCCEIWHTTTSLYQSHIHIERDREGDFTIFSQTVTFYFLELVTYYCLICVWCCTKPRGKGTRRWQEQGRGGDTQLKNPKLAFE